MRFRLLFTITLFVAVGLSAGLVHAAMAAASSPAPAPTRKSTDTDVVGIKLGMTHAEAIAAIRAHNPKLALKEIATDITINDSYRRPFKVGSYVAEVKALWDKSIKGYKNNDPIESISLVFAGPPSEHRVQSIEREVRYVDRNTYPNHDTLVAALTQKYGSPDYTRRTVRVWQLDGQTFTERQFGMWVGAAGVMQNPSKAYYRYHLFPVIDESLPKNVLNISDDGVVIRYGNRTFVDLGRSLGIHITQQGAGVHFMRTVLQDSIMTIGRSRKATAEMSRAALEKHEQNLLKNTQQQQAPKL